MQKRIRNLSDREKQQIGEQNYIKRLLELYPKGIVSVVSDTFNLWDVLTEYLPQLKEEILNRDGKLVIRPDSGDPVDIICGYWRRKDDNQTYEEYKSWITEERIRREVKIDSSKLAAEKGVIELLWDIFGGTINEQGFKVLDPHIGAIYGDSITLERATEICERLKAKGFASTNIVLGIGSYTYQYNTRDTFGFAIKATYGEITYPEDSVDAGIEEREIFKDPITDDGTKKSKKGLLQVNLFEKHNGNCDMMGCDMNGCMGICKELSVKDQCTWDEEKTGLLTTVFKDGKLVKETTLDEIRNKLNKI